MHSKKGDLKAYSGKITVKFTAIIKEQGIALKDKIMLQGLDKYVSVKASFSSFR